MCLHCQAAQHVPQVSKQRVTWECPWAAEGTLEGVRWSRGLMPGCRHGISPPLVGSKPTAPTSARACEMLMAVSRCLPERDMRLGSFPPAM